MIILSSMSKTRRHMLSQVGVAFKTARPPVDEDEIKTRMRGHGATATQVAEALAESKAASISAILPHAFVIGADQMLECGQDWFDKPVDRAAAKTQLRQLRGKTHELISAVAVVSNGDIVWRHVERARLTMREFSDDFLESYLDAVGDEVTKSVGAYQIEGLGAQLFDKIEGDYFTILGLPLIALLGGLRQVGALPS